MRTDLTIVAGSVYAEIFDDLIYDVIDVPTFEETARLFQVVRNQSGKSFIETNCLLSGVLPNPQEFRVSRILCAFSFGNSMVPVTHPIYWRSACRLLVGYNVRPYWQSPCWAIAHPAAVIGKDPRLAPDQFKEWKETAMGGLSEPIFLAPSMSFCGELETKENAFSTNFKFALMLEGIRKRPVR